MEAQARQLLVNRLLAVAAEVDQIYSSGQDPQPLMVRLESLYADIVELDLSGVEIHPTVIAKVSECLRIVEECLEECEGSLCSDAACGPGRPSFDISPLQIEHLLELGFAAVDIAKVLGVSRSTVSRRMRHYGLSVSRTYCCISDSDLDDIVRSISHLFPGCGNKMMEGHLRERGIVVQQTRIREALRRTDPEGTAIRQRLSIRRRQYNITFPQELWHIDGNHKLIRLAFSGC
jgi:predicted transcriptional regulator